MVKVRKSRQQYLEFDAQKYQQGGRTAYSLIMDLGTLDSNIPNFVNTERIDKANRRFHPTHAKRIAEYIYDFDDWVLGAILLGMDPDDLEFIPYEDTEGQASATLGFVRIPLDGGTSSIKILDGQHRRMAIQTVRERLRHEIQVAKDLAGKNGSNKSLSSLSRKFNQLDVMAIPVIIYSEANTKNLRRMFSDLAQTRNIDAVTKTRFDDRDPFNRAAVELVQLGRSELLAGRVDMERSTPSRTSNDLLAINQLARCLKILNFGLGGRASRARVLEAQHNYDDLLDLGITWADEFLPSARAEYEQLLSAELEEDFIASNRSHHLAYSVTVLQLMAGCYYDWTVEHGLPSEALASWLRDANFDPFSEGCMFRETGLLPGGGTTLTGQRQTVKATLEHIVEESLLSYD